MAAISFQDLSQFLPLGAITEVNDVVTVNINAVTGDPTIDFTSELVLEALVKLLDACYQCQTAKNNTLGPNDRPMTAFSAPSSSVPTRSVSRNRWEATFVYYVSALVPISFDTIDTPSS